MKCNFIGMNPCYRVFSFIALIALMTLSNLPVLAHQDQRITLNVNNKALKNVFHSIEEQAEVVIMYDMNAIDDNEKVSLNVKDQYLDDVLSKLLSSKSLKWNKKGNIVRIFREAKAVGDSVVEHPISISGRVTDLNGNPLPGATIRVKGSKKGASADISGQFNIANVEQNSMLIITLIGYEPKEIPVNGMSNLKVQLKQVVGDLDEAVVVAYGTTTQRANTGAVTVVKGKEIENLPNRSFDKSLQGLVPGLLVTSGTGQPGGGLSNFVLRGIATAADNGRGSTVRNPLIIMDGMPVSQDIFQLDIATSRTPITNPLAQLNPSDIESLTVLKDASAIALYGAKASNGVIVITTKRGKVGKTVFNFRHQTDIASMLKGKVNVLNQKEYLELLFESYRNYDPITYATDEAILDDLTKQSSVKFITKADGSFYPETDWYHEIFKQNAVTVSTDLSMSGGNEKSNFYLNLEYTKQDGVVRESGYDRKSLRFNFENRPANWLKVGMNSTLSYNIQNYGGSTRSYSGPVVAAMSPLNPVKNEEGNYVLNYAAGGGPQAESEFANPVAVAKYNINRNTAFRGLSKMYGELSFLNYFKFSSNVGIDFMLAEAKEKADPRLYDSGNFPSGIGRIEEQDTRRANLITTNVLQFNKSFNEYHALSVLLGQEAQVLTQRDLVVGVSNLTLPYYDQINSPGVVIYRYGGSNTKETLQSFFGQANYGYKNRYYFSSSVRRDGSSRFGEDKRYGTYWSTGIGWVISSESFMKDAVRMINFLKVRGSIGAAGNAGAINARTRYDQLQDALYQGGTAVYPFVSPGNPDVRWENTFISDAGIELRAFKDRISFSADIYRRKTSNLIYTVGLPQSSGYYDILRNIGEMSNKGVELSFTLQVIRKENFDWLINGNWSTNKNTLIKANVPVASLSTNTLGNKEGENFNSFLLVRWAGVDPADGSAQWLDNKGTLTKTFSYDISDKAFVGKPQPDGFGSLTNKVRYKSIELSAMLYYQYGYQIYLSDDLLNDGLYPYMNQSKRALDRWQKPGDVSSNPKRVLNNSVGYSPSSRYIYDGDHLRLQNVTISYNFPAHVSHKIGINLLKLYVQGNNLALWTTAPGDDPGNANVEGSSGLSYPNARTFSAGLNINF